MSNRDLRGQRALITGAGSGIGRQTAFRLAKQGSHLWLTDIDEAGLRRTAMLCEKLGTTVHGRVVDVADEQAMTHLATEVHAEGGALDVLVNNAGVGAAGKLVETDAEVWRWALGINVMGVVHGCRLFTPAMLERGSGGHIVNVASAAGLLAPPGMSVYATTKFAVVGLSESLRAELLADRINVTTLCPGVVDTPITRNTRLSGELAEREGFTEQVSAMYRKRGYGPKRVAQVLVRALQRGQSGVLPVTPEAWGMYFAKRIAPELVGKLTSRNPLI